MLPAFGPVPPLSAINFPVAPSLEDILPGIESALAQDGAQLLIVRMNRQALAFSIIIHRGDVLEVNPLPCS